MKNIKLILSAFCVWISLSDITAQTRIKYSYDEGGNTVERSLQVFVGARLRNSQAMDSTLIPLNFKVFPNPTDNYLNIEGDLPENIREAKVSLMNMNGQILKKDTYVGEAKTINVQDLKSGMYLLEFSYTNEKRSTYKIIVTN